MFKKYDVVRSFHIEQELNTLVWQNSKLVRDKPQHVLVVINHARMPIIVVPNVANAVLGRQCCNAGNMGRDDDLSPFGRA